MNKKAVTLLEILVSAIILIMVIAGIASIFVAGKRHILHARSRMGGGELGKLFLDPLQTAIRQDSWDQPNTPLQVTPASGRFCDGAPQQPNCPSAAERTLDNIPYNARYDISNHTSSSNIRKVKVTVTWTEPTL